MATAVTWLHRTSSAPSSNKSRRKINKMKIVGPVGGTDSAEFASKSRFRVCRARIIISLIRLDMIRYSVMIS